MRTLVLSLALSFSLQAQTPYLVKDINTTYSFGRKSSNPSQYTAQGDRVFFIATTDDTGTELLSTDGTSTTMLDLLPGPPSSNPFALRGGLGSLVFNARDVNHGVELWTTDGTLAGSRMLLDINPGPNSSDASTGVFYRNRWLFSADNGTNGRELWITDGTAAGTRLLKDIAPGIAASTPRSLVLFNDAVYFIVNNAIWKTDGTENGTIKVIDVNARNLNVAGALLFFEGVSAEAGFELWISDGTAAGTRMAKDIRAGNNSAFTNLSLGFTPVGNRVLFVANDGVHGNEFWISDGTDAGTHIVSDLTPGPTGRWDSTFIFPVAFNDLAYFPLTTAEHGQELWVTDGTEAGTKVFVDFHPGADSSFASPMAAADGKLYFRADPPGSGYQPGLWITDGTVGSIRQVHAADGGAFACESTTGRVVNGKLYFSGSTPLTGSEPWSSDGTVARMVANVAPDTAPSSTPELFAATTNGLLFFHATEGLLSPTSNSPESSLWRTDGTEAGTFKLRESGQHPSELTSAGPYVFFTDEVDRRTLMLSDGSHAGTGPADDFLQRFDGLRIMSFFPFGNTLFAAVGDQFDTELYRTTLAPYEPAIRLGASGPGGFTDVGGQHMFFAAGGLWITDGTPERTHTVVAFEADSSGWANLASAQGSAFFLRAKRDEPTKLWKSDGSFDGTTTVKEMPNVDTRSEIDSTGRRIFILSQNSLWVSDGTDAGTVKIVDFAPRSFGRDRSMEAVGDRVVFVLDDNVPNSYDLWGSDGTPAGTKILAKTYTESVTNIDGVVYFAGNDDAHGIELWTSDGTVEGTKLFFDLNPGQAGSFPSNFKKAGNTFYFAAHTAATGTELWAVPLTAPRISIRDARAGESSQSVRFTVTLEGTAQQSVSVDYNTSNGSATAGQDYEAKSGTLTFAPGEKSKTIDVRILGDTSPENNETFVLALSNAGNAKLLNAGVTGMIDDDDAAADLSAQAAFFAGSIEISAGVRITNHGPRGATGVAVQFTSVPATSSENCSGCKIPQIANGATAATGPGDVSSIVQIYQSAIVAARQHDPNPSNNTASWTITPFGDLAMSPAFLTPGQTATVSADTNPNYPYPFPFSLDPSIVSISSAVTTVDNLAKFTVTAHKPGTATITIGDKRENLLVTVVSPGNTPRWENGLTLNTDRTATFIGEPVTLTITPGATAPFTGARATGLVTVTANGQAIAHRIITGANAVVVPLYFRSLGSIDYQISYGGDDNFLPQTVTRSVFMRQGTADIAGSLQLEPGTEDTYRLNVRVTGGPGVAPTGTLRVLHNGVLKGSQSITPSSDGTSRAESTLTGLTGSPDVSVIVEYSGDALYGAASQEIRFVAPRRRNTRH